MGSIATVRAPHSLRSGQSSSANRALTDHVPALALEAELPKLGSEIAGKYRIVRLIGEGGMGVV